MNTGNFDFLICTLLLSLVSGTGLDTLVKCLTKYMLDMWIIKASAQRPSPPEASR